MPSSTKSQFVDLGDEVRELLLEGKRRNRNWHDPQVGNVYLLQGCPLGVISNVTFAIVRIHVSYEIIGINQAWLVTDYRYSTSHIHSCAINFGSNGLPGCSSDNRQNLIAHELGSTVRITDCPVNLFNCVKAKASISDINWAKHTHVARSLRARLNNTV